MAKDPICGMYVDESRADYKAEVRGSDYFFCSESCMKEFLAPEVEFRTLKQLATAGLLLTFPILLLTYIPVLPVPSNHLLLLVLATPVQFVVGWRFYKGAYHAIRRMASNMDLLVATGTTTAFMYSAAVTLFPATSNDSVYFDSSSVIITLVLIGRLLEHYTKQRATASVRKLMELRPTVAHSVVGGQTVDIPVEDLHVGDVFAVLPGEQVPTDGVVVSGRSSVDESIITGESMPYEKTPGSQVAGGSMNKLGYLRVRATQVGRDTALSQIARLVEEAQAGKAQIQQLVDRVAEYFVPLVVVVALAASSLWYFVGHVPLVTSVLIFVSVVVIACPCALGLATPAALVIGTAKGASMGILFKGGEPLEATQKVDVVIFDKTGTLTVGRPSVAELAADDEAELLLSAASVEAGSGHPLAAAIIEETRRRGIQFERAEGFQEQPGMGVSGTVDGREVVLGRRELFLEKHLDISKYDGRARSLEDEGDTVAFVSSNGSVLGVIGITDSVKQGAPRVVEQLTRMGIRVMMATGDNERAAAAVAKASSISEFYADMRPAAKEGKIEELQREGHVVAVVGDGINDAPALARADLGIAIGSGTDIAKETGGVILVRDDLVGVVRAVQIGRRTFRKIRQNLFWAFCYNVALIPVAAGALIPFVGIGVYSFLPIFAGAAMAFSSVTVVGNSLLLFRFKPTI